MGYGGHDAGTETETEEFEGGVAVAIDLADGSSVWARRDDLWEIVGPPAVGDGTVCYPARFGVIGLGRSSPDESGTWRVDAGTDTTVARDTADGAVFAGLKF